MKLTVLILMVSCVALMTAERAAAAGPLAPADVKLDGMKITIVPLKVTLDIEPLAVEKYEADITLSAGKPGWGGPRPGYLPKVAWVFRALTPGSLVVTAADKPDVRLVEGKDFLFDPDWAVLGSADGGPYVGKKVHCAYTWTASRFDLVEQTADGKVVVKKGESDPKGEPLLPAFTPGATLDAQMREQRAFWTRLVREANIQAE